MASPNEIYVRPSQSSRYQALTHALESAAASLAPLPAQDLRKGALCLARHRQGVARAEVTDLATEGRYSLRLVDSNEEAEVAAGDLFLLPLDILSIPVQAFKCNLFPSDTKCCEDPAKFHEWFKDLLGQLGYRAHLRLDRQSFPDCPSVQPSHLVDLLIENPPDIRGEGFTSVRDLLAAKGFGAGHISTRYFFLSPLNLFLIFPEITLFEIIFLWQQA